jgi:glucosamine--fructose-6-phosphate aminotransferase (isomerizing)
MCGIVAYSGSRNALPVLLGGLKKLEYRGYDSSGIALNDNGQITIRKRQGKVSELISMLDSDSTLEQATCGIAHTRWATHGPPTTENAHPHAGGKGDLALVHNGIIENHRSLREKLTAAGYVFCSETDTEVLAHLVDFHHKGKLLDAVISALREVEGAFGIAAISRHEPGVLVVARRGSPIVLGLGREETIVASDASAIIKHTRQAIYLDDNDIALIQGNDVEIQALDAGPVSRPTSQIDWSSNAAEKGGYEHYMLKEIFEQPEAIRNTLRGRLDPNRGNALLSGLNLSPRELSELHRVLIVGCGTSMNAGLIGEYTIEDFAGVLAEVEQAAEFRYRNPIVKPSDLVVAISQSGETADTLAAVREAIDKGALVSGLVNTVGSTIARETGRGVYLHAGPEISVASTKAFTCQVSVLLMMALKFARSRRMSRDAGCRFVEEIEAIPSLVEQVLEQNDNIAKVAQRYVEQSSAFFIGRGYLYPVALEGALKLKEISYIHAEGYHAAELKHGPIALLDENVPVIALCNEGPGKDKTLGNVAECQTRKSRVLGIVTQGDQEAIAALDDHIVVPASPPHTSVIPSTVALQLLSYHIARLKGCSIDQPRNLAKSVTVE